MSIDTKSLRKYIDRHGPPLSPMLIFTLLDEIDRYEAVVDAARAWKKTYMPAGPDDGAFEEDLALFDAVRALDAQEEE